MFIFSEELQRRTQASSQLGQEVGEIDVSHFLRSRSAKNEFQTLDRLHSRTGILVVTLSFVDALLSLLVQQEELSQHVSLAGFKVKRGQQRSHQNQSKTGTRDDHIKVSCSCGIHNMKEALDEVTDADKNQRRKNVTYLAHTGEDIGLSSIVAISTDSQVEFERSRVSSELDIHSKDGVRRAHLNLRPEALLAILRSVRYDFGGPRSHRSVSFSDRSQHVDALTVKARLMCGAAFGPVSAFLFHVAHLPPQREWKKFFFFVFFFSSFHFVHFPSFSFFQLKSEKPGLDFPSTNWQSPLCLSTLCTASTVSIASAAMVMWHKMML